MSNGIVAVIVVLVVLLVSLFLYILFLLFGSPKSQRGTMQRIMSKQRVGVSSTSQTLEASQTHAMQQSEINLANKERKNAGQMLSQVSPVKRKGDSRLTLQKRMRYAEWTMPTVLFRIMQVALGCLVASLLLVLNINIVFALLGFFFGTTIMNALLNMAVQRRFKKFDSDYAPFILSLVGLLKTGMTAMGALEAAALGLEEGSLVKYEANLMVERLRMGVSEDKSIGSFGETIYHSEIELFVQALLLSRRVGGTLSDTLERLAKQVRKRQYFRNSAAAAIGMQRGSIYVILGILAGLEGFMYVYYPDLVVAGFKTDLGWKVIQGGFGAIALGLFWIRQVTKIRV